MFLKTCLIAFVAVVGLAMGGGAYAAPTVPAEKFIQNLADRAIATMANPKLDAVAKKATLRTLLLTNFDLNSTGKFALGRYARGLSAAERTQYDALYRDMLVEVYARRFTDYAGQKFGVSGSAKQSNGDMLVNSIIKSPSSSDVKVDWRVRGNKIVDVIVEGVSMAVTQRAEFASVIEQGGGSMASLLTYLKAQANAKGK